MDGGFRISKFISEFIRTKTMVISNKVLDVGIKVGNINVKK